MALDEQIIAILEETGEDDPREAIRAKARELIDAIPRAPSGRGRRSRWRRSPASGVYGPRRSRRRTARMPNCSPTAREECCCG